MNTMDRKCKTIYVLEGLAFKNQTKYKVSSVLSNKMQYDFLFQEIFIGKET